MFVIKEISEGADFEVYEGHDLLGTCGTKEAAENLIQRLSALEVGTFTEKTLEKEGWYFFYPTLPREVNRFVHIEQDTIDDKALHCKKYAGIYMGPTTPPTFETPL